MSGAAINERILAASLRRGRVQPPEPAVQFVAEPEPSSQADEADFPDEGEHESQEPDYSPIFEAPPFVVEPSAPPLLRELSLGSFVITIRGVNGNAGSSLTLEVQNDGSGLVLRATSQGFDTSIAGEAQTLLDFPAADTSPASPAPMPELPEPEEELPFAPPPHAPHAHEDQYPMPDAATPPWLRTEAKPEVQPSGQAYFFKKRRWTPFVGAFIALLAVGAASWYFFASTPAPEIKKPKPASAVAAPASALAAPLAGLTQLPGDGKSGTEPSPTNNLAAGVVTAAPAPQSPPPTPTPIEAPLPAAQPPQEVAKPAEKASPQKKKPAAAPKHVDKPKAAAKVLPPPAAATPLPLPVAASKPQTEPRKDEPKAAPARVHEQTAMSLRQIVSPSEGKLIAWFADPSGREAPFREGERMPSGETVKKIDMAKGSVAVTTADGVSTVFFVGK